MRGSKGRLELGKLVVEMPGIDANAGGERLNRGMGNFEPASVCARSGPGRYFFLSGAEAEVGLVMDLRGSDFREKLVSRPSFVSLRRAHQEDDPFGQSFV